MSTLGQNIAALDIQRQTARNAARRDWRQGEAVDGGEAWARVERARQYGDTLSEVYWLAYREVVVALCETRERLGECATPGCDRTARWYSITEGNRHGNRAPRRCPVCCDAIAAAVAGDQPLSVPLDATGGLDEAVNATPTLTRDELAERLNHD